MRQYPSFIFALLIALVVLAVVSVIDNQEMRALETADHDLVRKELNVVENELEAALNARLFHARGLAAFVVARPNFSMADFERFANAIQGRQKGVRSLQLSPNAYVTYITDHRRNRISLGENLLTDGPQLPLIRKAIDERRLIVAGPMELSQGGNAIIARQPIFLPAPGSGAEEFWGFATILIDVPPMLEEAGVLTPPPGIEFAIRGKDGLGAEGEVFHGLAATFSDNPNIAEVALPTGTWQIAAKRIGAVPGVARWRVWLWTGGGALAFVVGLLLYFMLREPAQLRAAVDDATAALRESQEALQRSEELYTRATLAGKVGVWDWNLDTDELYFSRDLEEMLGCGEGEYIRTFEEFSARVRAGDAERQKREALEYLRSDDDGDFVSDYAVRTPDGEVRWFATRGNRMYDETGRAFGVTGTDTDVTETRRAQEALHAAKEQAETANRTKTDFLANISHELRTPLNSILGFAELIQSEPFGKIGDKRYREYISDIHGSGTHLLNVINEILDVSRVEAGMLDIADDAVDLREAFQICLTMVADRASKAGVEIKVELPDDIPVLTADPTRFKQIVLNLLSNAVKFTPPEGRIVLSAARADDGGLRVQVADTGIGIPDTALPSIFEPFVQVENVQQRSHEGAGLGLTLVKSLTELHGGTVSAESVPGEGTVVTVTFPAERLAEPAA